MTIMLQSWYRSLHQSDVGCVKPVAVVACTAIALQEAAPFVPEVEEEERAAAAATSSRHRLEADASMQGGLQVRKPAAVAPAAAPAVAIASGAAAVEPGAAAAGLDAKASVAAAAAADPVKERAKQKANELVAQFAEPAPQQAKRPIKVCRVCWIVVSVLHDSSASPRS